jgi:ribosomal protein S18 acetylase RimI-like enzyme
MKFSPDAWLAELFGYEVFRASFDEDEVLDPETIFAKRKLPGRAFYYVKVPVDSVAQANSLAGSGFQLVDVNVGFERQPALQPKPDGSILVRDIRPADETATLEIADTAFRYSRFHLDPFVSNELANRIKREWIANYIKRQRGDRLLVAEVEGKIAGFLALLETPDHTGVIDLIGVAKNMQGRGVGRSMVQCHVNEGVGKYPRLIVGTQIVNLPSTRLYENCGYHISSAWYVFHAHVKEGKILK